MPARTRIAVVIDYQNCYGAARRAFHRPGSPGKCGQLAPHRMASVLAAKESADHSLAYVGVYCGVPDPRRDARTAAARRKQIAAWQQQSGVAVVARPLLYPRSWPLDSAQEKGIDVKLAIDAVMLGVQGAYDVGIIASCDTDLAPVAEALLELHQRNGTPQVRAIAWVARQNRIRVAGRQLTHHWIDERDYRAMQDLTDYAA